MNPHGAFELDLRHVEHSRRASAWLDWNESVFRHRVVPTDAPDGTLEGYLRGSRLATGQVYKVRSAFRRLRRRPPEAGADSELFTAILQLTGSTVVHSAGSVTALAPDDITFLCGKDFEQEMSVGAELLLLQVPTELVRAQQPCATAIIGRRLQADDPVTKLIRGALLGAFDASPILGPAQQSNLLLSLIGLFGVPRNDSTQRGPGRNERRVEEAIRQIDARLFDVGFDANRLASSIYISRRRLDELFVRVLGRPVTPYIRERRLHCASQSLRDPSQHHRTVTDIVLSHGFEDVAHFARVFKKRYGVTALQWRAGGGAART